MTTTDTSREAVEDRAHRMNLKAMREAEREAAVFNAKMGTEVWSDELDYDAALLRALLAERDALVTVLKKHHDWHQQAGLEMKLGDEFFDCASAYCDGTLEEETTAILSGHSVLTEVDTLRKKVEELTASEEGAMAIIATERAEVRSLRKQLAAARNEALEEAAYQAQNACLVPPDGGSPTAEEVAVCEEAARRIRALKSTTPAPREVTPQEAAPDWEGFGRAIMSRWDEHLDVDALDRFELALKHGLLRKIPGGFDPEVHVAEHCDAERGDDWYEPTFSAIAQEGQSDE